MAIVARFRDLSEAEVASASLEAAGITNVLDDTQTIGVAWYYSTALGGIRLHVGEADLAEARALLDVPAQAEWPDLPAGSSDEQCPSCRAFALELDSGPRKTLAVMTAFGVPLWLWRSKLRCRSCGAKQPVPLRFRPEMAMAWLIVGMGVSILVAAVCLILGYAMYGRRA